MVYNITSTIQGNTIMNRGLMEIGSVAVPQAAMANNKIEARERLSKSGLFFAATFLSPLLTMPLFNKFSLKTFKVVEKAGENAIVQLSNKHLTGDLNVMREGIRELKSDLKTKKVDLDRFLKLDDKGLENVRQNLVKSKNMAFGMDFVCTGVSAGSIPWLVNNVSQEMTQRSGFSAEFGMADSEYTNQKASQHEKNKLKKYLTFIGITTGAAVAIPSLVSSSILKKNPKGIQKLIKDNAQKFDYRKGIYMSILPCFLMDFSGACVGEFFSCRDEFERKDFASRIAFILAAFYGGDKVLNNLSARFIDRTQKTKLVDKSKKSFWGAHVRSLEEINKLKDIDKKTLAKTKKFAVGIYWSTLLATMLAVGIALPKVLNKVLKQRVDNDNKLIEDKKRPSN